MPRGKARRIQDEESISAICDRYKAGEGMQQIGDSFNVDEQTISRILKRNGVQTRKKTVTPAVRAHNWEIALHQQGRKRGPYGPRRKQILNKGAA